MNKIALIDLDNVVADPTARFAKAEAVKMAYLEGCELPEQDEFFGTRIGDRVYQDSDVKRATDLYWRTAFTPEHVWLDTLIDGTEQALKSLILAGYDVGCMTSRPESMRSATLAWLDAQAMKVDLTPLDEPNLALASQLIMKPASQKFVKTVVWKSGVVELLVRLFGIDELLYVDDEQAHRDAISALSLPCELKVAASLQEAVALANQKGQ